MTIRQIRWSAALPRNQWAKVEIWKRLPVIVPLVVYHGADKWRIPNNFLALVDAPTGWRQYLLDFKLVCEN
ncbi:MAG: Rpn family recombination-promoting nuclease/putative transposase [Magnetococcales bacterium]|nr:Rpn family recombination-promoting nuclease/putative transposase [Magnetococcales bacterium]